MSTRGPIESKYHDPMVGLATGIDEILNGGVRPKKTGFVLLVFEFGKTDNGRVNYVSNADRKDMLTAMKEYIARAEGMDVETPRTAQ